MKTNLLALKWQLCNTNDDFSAQDSNSLYDKFPIVLKGNKKQIKNKLNKLVNKYFELYNK